jgi:integrase
MHWEKRSGKKGEAYYSFVYWDGKLNKNIRLRREEIPSDITTDKAAEGFCRRREAEHEAARFRILRRIQLQQKFHNFDKLMGEFEANLKTYAPNSFSSTVTHFSLYVVPFFLGKKQSNNIYNWPLHYFEYRKWIVDECKTVRGNRELSWASRNHAITALNNFVRFYMQKHPDAEEIRTCSQFPDHFCRRRGVEAVLEREEEIKVRLALREVDTKSLDFFDLLMATGLRINEAFGISMDSLGSGEAKQQNFKMAFHQAGLRYHGYLYVDSQLRNKSGSSREKCGRVLRKPLKWCKEISISTARLIPIEDKDVFNMLVARYKEQRQLLEKRRFGADAKDYLLFDGLTKTIFSKNLKKAFKLAGLDYRSPHCCRHTFATRLSERTGSNAEVHRLVIGHKTEKERQRYVHLAQQMAREARSAMQLVDDIEFVA